MAKRYDKDTKKKVVEFIVNYNNENGRGGQSAATKKYSINPITIKSWMEKAGVASPGKKGKKRNGHSPGSSRRGGGSGTPATATLNRMVSIQEKIAELNAEYEKLKATL